MRNLFCNSEDLHNEADVEAQFVEQLIRQLGFPANRIRRKAAIERLPIPRGSRTVDYAPDYVLLDATGRPVVVIDAKSPDEDPTDYRYQVSGYALLINQRYDDNPIRYCVVSNALNTELLRWDRDEPELTLRFNNFDVGDSLFATFRSAVSYQSFNQEQAVRSVRPEYRKPTITEIVWVFEKAHEVIRNREKYGPTKAFYELTKLLFVKLRQDQGIHDIIREGGSPQANQFYFTVEWIENQPTVNPVNNPLFRDIQEGLETEIQKGNKKRIFQEGEAIELRPQTIKEVVRLIESYDLHGIDEDLNGRMFETFLNATVRGKELGQFFTPRSVVKYMTKAARLRIRDKKIPRVLDACCGSGGFLIEALAELQFAIRQNNQLTNTDKEELLSNLQTDSLYGIEANDEIGRIARLNMYLHGDGGSRIYIADSLDKEMEEGEGLPGDRQEQFEQLRELFLNEGIRFDVILTNPPFSMSYSRSKTDERRVLDQYAIVHGTAANSNVLFLERYFDLLSEGGELLTVIDDTVLNGPSAKPHRDFLRERFIIKQVVSLPFNTFFRAQANIKTSILHLRKKRPGEQQGAVFMSILNNVGHNDHKGDTPHRDNLPEVTNLFTEWEEQGSQPTLYRENEVDEPLGCPLQVFVVSSDELSDRLDAFYYAPELKALRDRLRGKAEAEELTIKTGRDFRLVKSISAGEREMLRREVLRYIEITGVTRHGIVVDYQEAPLEDLPSRAKLRLQEGDVLFAKNNSSRGTTISVPAWLAGGTATSGFISIRPDSEEDSLILWTVMRSETWRKQVYYLAVTASQPEVRENIFRDEMLVPWPTTPEQRTRIVDSARRVLQAREAERLATEDNQGTVDDYL